jgi:RNA polymerase sigma-70 factor (ECF subfamily)
MPFDKDLMIQLRDANEDAFRQVFDRYGKKVYRYILHYVKVGVEAEDITQNVFLRIWEKRGQLDPEKSFEGFIFTIAYRAVMDHFRANPKRLQSLFPVDLLNDSVVSTVNADALLNHHQLESIYQQALQALPPKRKEIFLLSRHGGLTNRQIAEQLGISIKTVESQMTAALSFLKNFFSHSDFGRALITLVFIFH